MRSTVSASPRPATSRGSDRKYTTAAAGVSLARLYLLRLGYLVVAVGLAVTKWPLIIMDPATLKVFYSCLVVLIVLAVIPWRYVVAQYVRTRAIGGARMVPARAVTTLMTRDLQ